MRIKDDVLLEDFLYLHPALFILISAFAQYCYDNGLPCTITSMKSDRIEGRVSTSHKEGRAFDASVKGWSKTQIETYVKEINNKYEGIAAISKSDNKARAVIYHDGTGYHLHHQVRP